MLNISERRIGETLKFSFVLPTNDVAALPDVLEKSIVCGRNRWLVSLLPALALLGA